MRERINSEIVTSPSTIYHCGDIKRVRVAFLFHPDLSPKRKKQTKKGIQMTDFKSGARPLIDLSFSTGSWDYQA